MSSLWSDLNVSAYVVAAICGCFAIESGVNPGIWESLIPCAWDYEYEYNHKGGYGLGQWTNVGTPYGRNYQRHVWMQAEGYSDDDGAGQLAFIVHENYWVPNWGPYTNLLDFLTSQSTDIPTLTHAWLACWEGGGTIALPQRIAYAEEFYDYIVAHAADDPTTYQWITGNMYLSHAETLNNVMCVWFNSGGPLHKIHVWLLYKMAEFNRRRRLK